MYEYGIFSDEGLIEGDFWSEKEAAEAIQAHYSEVDGLYVGLVEEEEDEDE